MGGQGRLARLVEHRGRNGGTARRAGRAWLGPWLGLCLALSLLASAPTARASDDYPSRPITIVVPFPPGAAVDVIARIIGDKLGAELGQSVVIENRGGAGGTTGTAYVSRAEPTGYVLLLTPNSTLTQLMFTQKNVAYDSAKMFAPVSFLAETVLVLGVHPSLPVKSVTEFIDYAKARPGKLSYGSSGTGSPMHIAGELLKKQTAIDVVHVPYAGGGPAAKDLVGNHIQAAFGAPPSLVPLHQSGLVRIIATTGSKRFPMLPDIPTIGESVAGMTAMDATIWYALLAPAGTPPSVIKKLNAATAKVNFDAEVVEKYKSQGLTPIVSSPEKVQETIVMELGLWGKIIPEIGMGAQ